MRVQPFVYVQRFLIVLCGSIVIATGSGVLVPSASAQLEDHLKCYTISDALALKGLVDVDTPQFGLEAGCTIGPAVEFCVPASKTVHEAFDRRTPITLLPIEGPPAAGDYLCYKLTCPVDQPCPGIRKSPISLAPGRSGALWSRNCARRRSRGLRRPVPTPTKTPSRRPPAGGRTVMTPTPRCSPVQLRAAMGLTIIATA